MQVVSTTRAALAPEREIRRLPLLAMLSANAISGAGNALVRLAIPWFVLETTGSAARTGLVGAVEVLPLVIAGLFGGTLVDRVGFRRMSVVSDFASGATVAVIPALYFTVGLAFWQLLLLVFAGALLDAPGQTARRSFVPELADEAGVALPSANGYFEAISRSTGLVGPPIAGVLIAVFGAAPLLWINAGTFVISAALMMFLVPARLEPEPDPSELRATYLSDLVAGFRWIRQDVLIRTLIAMILVTNLIEAPMMLVLLVYAREVYDSAVALGVLIGVFSVGAILGSIISGAVTARVPGRWIFPLGFSVVVLFYGALLGEPPFLVVLAVAALTGVVAGPMNPVLSTVFQERVPPRMRGRVFGLRSALMMSAAPLGILAGGVIIGAAGFRTMLVIQLCAMSLAVLWMVLSPTLRDLRVGMRG